ncbi:polysaccharide biosynthesis tyrosine autokinase [Geodermatophilus sp. YIM 151500]|uniref:polysaccharide biosynthesis tyrosine autokinase n=1 Tax=Geodermatophilus sp. YIM 151500 TaxID=2984531 RepID=UPI0021E47953|nr:polysaccharide biosynthesis tyrosine autokinase [Geodermatophilus sp. YIM 151500]MCV2491136.1 polysaccharide biosynthesis tyrosine autokinase [Geodermatophilus sp. YIM 151500]
MTYAQYLRSLRAGWWLLVVGLLLGGAVATGLTAASIPRYQTTTQLFVTTGGATDLAAAVQGGQFSQQRVASYARLLEGRGLMSVVIDRLDLPLTADELGERIDAVPVPDTVLLDVVVTDTSPRRALDISRALQDEFADLIGDLETLESSSDASVKVTVVSPPELPSTPITPRAVRDLAVGLVLGLLGGVGAALVRTHLDTAIRDRDAAGHALGAPVVGAVPFDASLTRKGVAGPNDTSRVAEAFRRLRANLLFLQVDRPPRVILVASPLAEEGKTTVAVHLAVALAESGQRVTLVEADLRRPTAVRSLGGISGAGLTNVLTGSADLDDVLQEHGGHGDGRLTFLAAGPLPPNPGELLASAAMHDLIGRLTERSDVVLVDGPPLLPVADAVGLAPLTDGVLLCIRHGSSRWEQVGLAAETLDRVGAVTLGAVLTLVPPRAAGVLDHGYGYAARSHPRHGPDGRRRDGWWRRRRRPDRPTVALPTSTLRPATVPRRQPAGG